MEKGGDISKETREAYDESLDTYLDTQKRSSEIRDLYEELLKIGRASQQTLTTPGVIDW
jgi:hypothetical protein